MKGLMLAACTLVSLALSAQKDFGDRPKWTDRIYTGGGLGFNGGRDGFGNRYFNISVSPIVGYMITQQFSGGIGLSYQRVGYPDIDFSYTQYGIMPFLRYNFNDFFLITEYDYINLPRVTFSGGKYSEASRFYKSRMLVGAGYSKPLGARARVNAIAMYDLLYSAPSVFYSPWVFRVFVSF